MSKRSAEAAIRKWQRQVDGFLPSTSDVPWAGEPDVHFATGPQIRDVVAWIEANSVLGGIGTKLLGALVEGLNPRSGFLMSPYYVYASAAGMDPSGCHITVPFFCGELAAINAVRRVQRGKRDLVFYLSPWVATWIEEGTARNNAREAFGPLAIPASTPATA